MSSQNSQTASVSTDVDVEKLEGEGKLESNNEPLEKAKKKRIRK